MLNSIIRTLAFRPPPCTYRLVEDPTAEFGLRLAPVEGTSRRRQSAFNWNASRADAFVIIKQDNTRLVGFRVRPNNLPKPARGEPVADNRSTVIYSHSNGCDIGELLPYAVEFADAHNCDVISYDYTGYGLSTGLPTRVSLQEDIYEVYRHIINKLHVNPKTIVLHGESIGTFPSVYLAAHVDVKAVILEGALASGLRVLVPSLRMNPLGLDCFRSIDYVPLIRSPVLFVHSVDDEVCSFKGAQTLYSLCPGAADVVPFWVTGYDHNSCNLHPNYHMRIQTFMETGM